MGFRDFTCFNMALFAKQCWRLWHQSDSLMSKILKAKYYARSTILETQLENKPSFAWRSIVGALDVMQEGLVWRFGNGAQVRIWGDKWLPTPTAFSIQTPPSILDPKAHVSELIDNGMQWWNLPLIESMFRPKEVQAIKSIPLNTTNQQDKQKI